MQHRKIKQAIADIRAGKLVIVADDENRENEGDLVGAAEKVTPEMINFMATHARGLICLTLMPERCQALGLTQMAEHNTEAHETAFTVSIDAAARFGVTTGISAVDRAATIRVAIDPATVPADLRRPGHVFPLRARPGGVLQRVGQTEASVDLARLAGLYPAGVICEVLNADGSMARRSDLERVAARHGPPEQTQGLRTAGRGARHRRGEPRARLQARPPQLRHRGADPARSGALLDSRAHQQSHEAGRARGLRPRDRRARSHRDDAVR